MIKPNFHAIEKQLVASITKAHHAGVQAMGESARELCPVDTGKTRDSIKIDVNKGTISNSWHVSWYLELGTEHMPAHPFMRPAFDHGVRPMIRNIKDSINKVLED